MTLQTRIVKKCHNSFFTRNCVLATAACQISYSRLVDVFDA